MLFDNFCQSVFYVLSIEVSGYNELNTVSKYTHTVFSPMAFTRHNFVASKTIRNFITALDKLKFDDSFEFKKRDIDEKIINHQERRRIKEENRERRKMEIVMDQ